jgi:hypothetical protein
LLDLVNFEYFDFEITPKEYLKFAKQDLKDNSDRALVNALSNAKRSIDCLIESTLQGLSINIEKNGLINNFCNKVLSKENKSIEPMILKLFTALGFAPSVLITKVRKIRNDIEHEYKLPKKEDVIEAIEVAELLIHSVESKRIKSSEILLIDKNRNRGILFDLSVNNKFNLNFVEIPDDEHIFRKLTYNFNEGELIYYYFIRAMIVVEQDEEELFEVIKLLISEIKPTLLKEHIKCKMY